MMKILEVRENGEFYTDTYGVSHNSFEFSVGDMQDNRITHWCSWKGKNMSLAQWSDGLVDEDYNICERCDKKFSERIIKFIRFYMMLKRLG